ncbi:hypothetical protein, partial [Tolypothrix sp. NIES-4075]|uniref:hypothetical protein n=1 Tax=Tolypothrix sp. NIES-4075 TaxID=2005459 RepID=UPI0011804A5D
MRLASGQPPGQAAFGTAGGLVGGLVGGAIGSLGGPAGTFVGGMLGGFVGGAIADIVWDFFPSPQPYDDFPFPYKVYRTKKKKYHISVLYNVSNNPNVTDSREFIVFGPISLLERHERFQKSYSDYPFGFFWDLFCYGDTDASPYGEPTILPQKITHFVRFGNKDDLYVNPRIVDFYPIIPESTSSNPPDNFFPPSPFPSPSPN